MGYSHYWTRTRKNKEAQFAIFSEVCQRIVDKGLNSDKILTNIYDYSVEIDNPDGGENLWIRFNEDSEKSFKPGFDFCKTDEKGSDYDTVVVACLYAASTMLGYLFESDGNRKDLQAGKQLFLSCK